MDVRIIILIYGNLICHGSSKTSNMPEEVFDESKMWYNHRSFMCTKSCWHTYEMYHSKEVIQKENCTRMGVAPSKLAHPHCAIRRLNTTRFTNVNMKRSSAVQDTRIVCRPYNDRMGWYRGKQAVTVRKQPCLRWDSIKSLNYSSDDFNRFQSPSHLYTLRNSIVSVSDHFNYCRNPDNHELGPWCYVRSLKKEIIRNSCFSPCSSFSNQLCLRKNHYPYRLLHRAVKYEKYFPLKLVDRISIEKHNKVIDLMDILDVAHIMNQIPHATSAIKIGPLGIPHARGYTRGHILSTRKRCYQTGAQTQILGPWTTVKGNLSTTVLKYIKDGRGYNQYSKFALVNMHPEVGHQLWEPCFPSCEDETIQCWPDLPPDFTRNTKKIQRMQYYGKRTTTITGGSCMPWPEVLETMIKARDASTKFLFKFLFTKFYYSGNGTFNHFMDGQGYLLNRNYCLDMQRLLKPNLQKLKKSFFNRVAFAILDSGPGCFFTYDKILKYQSCFRPCSCSVKLDELPTDVLQILCGNETAQLCVEKREEEYNLLIPPTEEYPEKIDLSVGRAPLIVLLTIIIFPSFGLIASICFCCVLRRQFNMKK
ncbi:unnamed protein product [Auanema sp. JU1783]|nr:unnamed protein product [Auanema sp. JU1783]